LGPWADGGGSSLEKIDPRSNGGLPQTGGTATIQLTVPGSHSASTGILDQGNTNHPADSLEITLQGEGECLIDNIIVTNAPGSNNVNLVSIPLSSRAQMAGFSGNHDFSSLETSSGLGGDNSSQKPSSSPTGGVTRAATESELLSMRHSPRIDQQHLGPDPLVAWQHQPGLPPSGNWLEAGGHCRCAGEPRHSGRSTAAP